MSEENAALQLDNQVCFPVYALAREIINLYRPLLEALDLTYPQYLVMMVLWEKDGKTVNQIGQLLLLDSGTLTPLLKRLEIKGLINRQRSKEDERVVQVYLTPDGINLKSSAEQVPLRLLEKTGFQQDDLIQLKNITCKLLHTLNQQ